MSATQTLSYALPDPCLVCAGIVTYSGKGRRPLFCSPDCRRADRTRYERDRSQRASASPVTHPLLAELVARRRSRVATSPYVLVRRTVEEWMIPGDDLRGTDWHESFVADGDGPGSWRAHARRRSNDAAAQWLAEHHPQELADFPPDIL
jgi:hypothetical protein